MMKMRDHTITPPEPHVTLFRCRICKDDVAEYYTSQFNGICTDCEREYIKSKAAELATDFIAENELDFYLKWWFDGLLKDEKLAIAKAAYSTEKMLAKHSKSLPGMEAEEAEFCVEHKYFSDFVKEREV